jgi:hypothetical protein
MISLFAVGFFSGSLLGLRYKVLILVPASLLAAAIVLLCFAAVGGSLKMIATAALDIAIALQVGYACGLGLRFALAETRADLFPRDRSTSVAA